MSMIETKTNETDSALDRLVNREEVLQICYWCEGEGFGDVFSPVMNRQFHQL